MAHISSSASGSQPATNTNQVQQARNLQAKSHGKPTVASSFSDVLNQAIQPQSSINQAVSASEEKTDKTSEVSNTQEVEQTPPYSPSSSDLKQSDASSPSSAETTSTKGDPAAEILLMAQYQQQSQLTNSPSTKVATPPNEASDRELLGDALSSQLPPTEKLTQLIPSAHTARSINNKADSAMKIANESASLHGTKKINHVMTEETLNLPTNSHRPLSNELAATTDQTSLVTPSSTEANLSPMSWDITSASTAHLPQGTGNSPSDSSLNARLQVDVPVYHAQFPSALQETVSFAVKQGLQEAEINLNPSEMGPIKIKIKMHEDRAIIEFVTQHPETRRILESASTHLRDMMAESGVNLGQMNFSSHDGQSFDSQQSPGNQLGGGAHSKKSFNDQAMSDQADAVLVTPKKIIGLVDTFA